MTKKNTSLISSPKGKEERPKRRASAAFCPKLKEAYAAETKKEVEKERERLLKHERRREEKEGSGC